MSGRWIARRIACTTALVVGVAVVSGCAHAPVTAVPSSSASVTMAALPPSTLVVVPPFAYADSTAARAALDRGRVGDVLTAFEGGLARDIVLDGQVVGGIQAYRFAPDVAKADHARFPPMLVYTFSGSTPHQSKVGGQVVQRVDAASDGRSVVGWARGDYVVVVWTYDRAVATRFVGDYILRSM